MAWIDLTPELTDNGKKKLKIGQIMMFDFEGSPIYLKIMRKKDNRVWAKRLDPAKYLTPEEADSQVEVAQD